MRCGSRWLFRDCAVDQSDRAYRLVGGSTCRDINASSAVINGEANISPSPIPNLIDSSLTVIENQVARRKLLAPNVEPCLAAIEGKISHEAAAAVFDKQATVLGVRWHSEDQIL